MMQKIRLKSRFGGICLARENRNKNKPCRSVRDCEFYKLSDKERLRVVEIAANQASGRIQVIAQPLQMQMPYNIARVSCMGADQRGIELSLHVLISMAIVSCPWCSLNGNGPNQNPDKVWSCGLPKILIKSAPAGTPKS